jgi:quinoprotein glucose dehydrogenase
VKHFPIRAWSVALVAVSGLAAITPRVLGQAEEAGGGRRAPVVRSSLPDVEWKSYGNDLGNTRYSPLDQINAANFNQLEVAWRFKTENLGALPEYKFESTPLMVGGIVYSTAGTRRAVVALDATTGELLWMYSKNEGERGLNAPRQLSGRGLAYWNQGDQARIVYVTPGYQMISLDAKTGVPDPKFGVNGVVDLKTNFDQAVDPNGGEVGLHATPIIAKDVIVVGAAHGVGTAPPRMESTKGYVRGFDVRTGKRLWIFHTIPKPGEFGYDTWENKSADRAGWGGVWAQISVDETLNLAYLPVELPTGDLFGGHRPGNGLFGESVVAVDLHTGQRRWHYQLVHHGLWDSDIPCAPILADIVVNGRSIKAVAQPSKTGFLYVFNRETGEPVWPIEERPVPKGDVPGEWYSPTQPFPTKPAPFDRQGVSVDDLIDFTPALRAEAVEVAKNYRIGPLFTPPSISDPASTWGTLTLPHNQGGANWPGGAFDPETKIAYLYSQTIIANFGIVRGNPATTDFPYSGRTGPGAPGGRGVQSPGGTAPAGRGGLAVQGLPLVKPPYGRITAIDLNRGEIVWQVAHGDTPDNIRNSPALKGLNVARTGQPGQVGTLVTKTLVIAGEPAFTTANHPRGALLRAYDKKTGADVAAVFLPAPATGSPMTYRANGRQYLVVAIGGAGFPAELIAFRVGN